MFESGARKIAQAPVFCSAGNAKKFRMDFPAGQRARRRRCAATMTASSAASRRKTPALS